MEQVNGSRSSGAIEELVGRQPDEAPIQKGDQVDWAGDLKLVQFRTVCGDGPFEVEEVKNGKVTVITNVGLANFSDKLFRKVE